MMFRFVNNTTGKWQMKCTHCGMVAASNATKLVYHAAQIRGGNIRICTSIPSDLYKEKYHSLFLKMTGAAATRKTAVAEEMLDIIEQQQTSAATYLTQTRKRSSGAEAIDVESSAPAPTPSSSLSNKKKAKNTIQSMLVTTKPGREEAARMDVCIANFLLIKQSYKM